jgi:hypothetical protein
MPSAAANRRESAVIARSCEKPGPKRRSYLVLMLLCGYCPPMLFQPPQEELSDEEIAAVLRQSIACAGRLPRHADVSLAGVCAEHLVDGLRAAGLIVARPVQWRLHP